MPLDQNDLIQIENVMLKTLKPMQDEIVRNTHTLFGPTGNNGLTALVKRVELDIEAVNRWKWRVAGAVTLAAGVMAAFGKFILDHITTP